MHRSPNRVAGLVIGAPTVAIGMWAIVAAAQAGAWIGPPGVPVAWLFTASALGGVPLAAGGLALAVAGLAGATAARRANLVTGAAWLGLGYAGLFLAGAPHDPFALNGADEVLLFASAAALLAVGLGARRDRPANHYT